GAEAIEFEPHSDDPIVVRPHRSSLIIVWIECRIPGRERADTPSCPHVRRHQAFHNNLGPLARHDARPKAMASIRGDSEDFPFIAVERISIKAELVIPKCRIEPFK